MFGIFSKLNDKVCEAELEQRASELSTNVNDISNMRARELHQLGKRMAKLERDIAETYKAPPSDVFPCSNRCWKNRGAIIGDLKATAKGMKPNLQSLDPAVKERGHHMRLICSLLTTTYRAAILENDTKSLVQRCRDLRIFAADLAEALKSAGRSEDAARTLEESLLDIQQRCASLR